MGSNLLGKGDWNSPITSNTWSLSCSGHGKDWAWLTLDWVLSPSRKGLFTPCHWHFCQLQGFVRLLLNPRVKAWERLFSLEARTLTWELCLLQGTVNCLYRASQCWKREIYHPGWLLGLPMVAALSQADDWSHKSPPAERKLRWHQLHEWFVTPGLHFQHGKFCIK